MAYFQAKSVVSQSELPGLPELIVDLDGTLLRTNTFGEALLLCLKTSPVWSMWTMWTWLRFGIRGFRVRVYEAAVCAPHTLPFNVEFLSYLKEQSSQGRRLVLMTGAHEAWAFQVNQYLGGLFHEVYGSHMHRTLIGVHKLHCIERLQQGRPFAYAGNDFTDIVIWQKASVCLLVNPRKGLIHYFHKRVPGKSIQIFDQSPTWGVYLRLMAQQVRLHQWVKNLLLGIPALAAHRLSWSDIGSFAEGFFAFGLCASGIYVFNDLVDLPNDRAHPHKKHRPFASGQLPLEEGFVLFPALILGGLGVGWHLVDGFFATLCVYVALTTAYSFKLKELLLLDVITLALLYNVRMVAGGVLLGIPLSPWLLGFGCFLFFSLALAKRVAELRLSSSTESSPQQLKGRAYMSQDLPILMMLGSASGLIAVVILALYMNSPGVQVLYQTPAYLWWVGVCLLYGVSRIWVLAARGHLQSDPVVFALKDPVSYLLTLLALVWIYLAF